MLFLLISLALQFASCQPDHKKLHETRVATGSPKDTIAELLAAKDDVQMDFDFPDSDAMLESLTADKAKPWYKNITRPNGRLWGNTQVPIVFAYAEDARRTYSQKEADVNTRFHNSQFHIIRRHCPSCRLQDVWYRRFSTEDHEDPVYNTMVCNSNPVDGPGNALTYGRDYQLYDSLSAALNGSASENDGSMSPLRMGGCAYHGFPGLCATASIANGNCSVYFFLYEDFHVVMGRKPSYPSEGMVAWFQSEFIQKDASGRVIWPSSASYHTAGDDSNGDGQMDVKVTSSEDTLPVRTIVGSTQSVLRFPTILNSNFTICSISRYTGSTNQRRLLAGTDTNVLHGHWNGYAGIAYYHSWVTSPERGSASTGWVVLCGGIESAHILVDGRLQIDYSAVPVQGLAVNAGGCCWTGDASDFTFMELAVWDRKLSSEEMADATKFFEWKLQVGAALYPENGTTYMTLPELQVAADPTPRGMVAWFKSSTISNGWTSSIGNFVSVITNAIVKSGSGQGAFQPVQYLQGGSNSTIDFGAVLAPRHTICSVTRYTDKAAQGVILTTDADSNYSHGHYNGRVGIAVYDDVLRTFEHRNVGSTHWLVFCGSNGGGSVFDGTMQVHVNQRGHRGGNDDGYRKLMINRPQIPQNLKSNFAVMEVITWNRVLSDHEMSNAAVYLLWRLRNGIQDGSST